jgi:hypothetical protein
MKSKFIYVVSDSEKYIYQIEYSWRQDNYLTTLVFTKYYFTVTQIATAELIWYCTSQQRTRELWHKIAGWELINGISVPKYIHPKQERNIEPQYLKYNKRKNLIDLKYFQLLDSAMDVEIEFFRRLPIT